MSWYRSEAAKRAAATTYKYKNVFNLPPVKGYIKANEELKWYLEANVYRIFSRAKQVELVQHLDHERIVTNLVGGEEFDKLLAKYPHVKKYVDANGRDVFREHVRNILNKLVD